MGIQGLHQGLKFCTKKTNISEFEGKTAAVDASSWLHKSVYSVSEKYVEAMEQGNIDPVSVRASARYVISRCEDLLHKFRIRKLYLVMDGKRCPLKADTNDERERRRQQNLSAARKYKSDGNRSKAEDKYKMCIKIKDEHTRAVMKEVKQKFQKHHRVLLVWSPYEADAQLAKLCVDNEAHVVITEDSDVLVYSVAAHCAFPVLFKLDKSSGNCDLISMDWFLFPAPVEATSTKHQAKTTSLENYLRHLAMRQSARPGFGARLFVQACVLAGSDYSPNLLPGLGLVNAFKLIRENAIRNDAVRFSKLLCQLPPKMKVGLNIQAYETILAKSEAVFFYHLVRYKDQSIQPLCRFRNSAQENGDSHHRSDHFPFMDRFNGDSSFLGEIQHVNTSQKEAQSETRFPLHEIIIPNPVNQKTARKPNSAIDSHKVATTKHTFESTRPLKSLPRLKSSFGAAKRPARMISGPVANPYVKKQRFNHDEPRNRSYNHTAATSLQRSRYFTCDASMLSFPSRAPPPRRFTQQKPPPPVHRKQVEETMPKITNFNSLLPSIGKNSTSPSAHQATTNHRRPTVQSGYYRERLPSSGSPSPAAMNEAPVNFARFAYEAPSEAGTPQVDIKSREGRQSRGELCNGNWNPSPPAFFDLTDSNARYETSTDLGDSFFDMEPNYLDQLEPVDCIDFDPRGDDTEASTLALPFFSGHCDPRRVTLDETDFFSERFDPAPTNTHAHAADACTPQTIRSGNSEENIDSPQAGGIARFQRRPTLSLFQASVPISRPHPPPPTRASRSARPRNGIVESFQRQNTIYSSGKDWNREVGSTSTGMAGGGADFKRNPTIRDYFSVRR